MPTALAPYNFVALPAAVVPAEQPLPDGDRYHLDRLTGTIAYTITARSPLFIHATVPSDPYNTGYVARFFQVNGSPVIPGSELRGAIHTLFEIVTWSRPRSIANDLIFYRK